jgi:hypothetical protein
MAGVLSEIKKGLADRLSTVPNLRVATQIPEQINPPMAVITRANVTYHQDMGRGLTRWDMQVQCLAGRMAEQQAQRTIDGWLSEQGRNSIPAAIEGDGTLGGAAHDTVVTDAESLTAIQVGDSEYLAVTFNVIVYA